MQFLQRRNEHCHFLFVLLFHKAVQLVDVTSRTDDIRSRIRFGQLSQIRFQAFPFTVLYRIVQDTHRTDVVRTAAHQLPLRQQVDFRAATSHVDIHVVTLLVFHVLHVIVVDNLGLLLSVDDIDVHICFLFDLLDDFQAILSVAHRRCRTGTAMFHIIDFHQITERLHQTNHVLFFLFRNFSDVEHVESQPERDT